MKCTLSLTLLAIFILLSSCNSDDDVTSTSEDSANLYALTVGNSWVYKLYKRVDNTDDYELLDYNLTTTITGTEIINGETYFVFEGVSSGTAMCDLCETVYGLNKFREEAGALINEENIIEFTNQTIEPYLKEQISTGDLYGVYISSQSVFETPDADLNDVEVNEVYLLSEDGTQSTGREYYAYKEGVGLVARTISTVSAPLPIYYLVLE